jgi:hypothetical protein
MTVDIEDCERLSSDAGRGRLVTMRDGISALNKMRDPPFWRNISPACMAVCAAPERGDL